VSGEKSTITVTDKLPPGLVATAIHASPMNETGVNLECTPKKLPTIEPISCTYKEELLTGHGLQLAISVKAELPKGTVTTLQNEVAASGGGIPTVSARQPVSINEAKPSFGVTRYALTPEEENGEPDSRAGTHPFQLTTSLAFNQNTGEEPVALPRNLQFNLPPGLIGNPQATPRCSETRFDTLESSTEEALLAVNQCPGNTAVGIAQVTVTEPFLSAAPFAVTVPVFNMEPGPGEPARFGLLVVKVPVVLDTSVRTGGDYGVTVSVKNASQAAGLIASNVTIWGVPNDPRHDAARGWACANHGPATTEGALKPCKEQQKASEEQRTKTPPKPFLSLPTSCGIPLKAPMTAQSWVIGAEPVGTESEFQESLGECGPLPFGPSISVKPDANSASSPTGLTVSIKVPQPETAEGLAESAVKSTTVTLPEGLGLSPAAANGLRACSALQFGFEGAPESAQTSNASFSPGVPTCPDMAKVGTVSIRSPDLKNPLEGVVYLAAQDTNPFQAPLVLYLFAEDKESGVRVKLAGTVTPNEATGQVSSTFENTPEAPFEDLTLHFFKGERAANTTPPLCGTYTTATSFTPWSGNAAATPSETFNVTSGVGGGPCPSNPLPFAPSLTAGGSNLQAGAFTQFALTIKHPDGNEQLEALTMHLPPGMAAMLSSVTPCPEPQSARNECGPESLIGHSTAISGLGTEPVMLPGTVYLTGPYKGAPFGISVVTPAVAGPFNLGNVTVRSQIRVDPETAAVTVVSDPFPTLIKGVPAQIKEVNVVVDRPNFQFNPTNCKPMPIQGALTGTHGVSAGVSAPFQVANCASLPFGPKLTASTSGQASKSNGASLNVKVESPGFGQDSIAKVELQLPVALPSRLTTIQKACPEAVFAANPASCNEGSVIGKAIIHTPVLKNPLSGPAYLVSHGNAAFPDVEFVLQGENLTLILDGKTDIKKGITYSRFEATPDAPFTTFVTELPTGPHSALGANVPPAKNYSLCGANLAMPTKITAQNGAVINQTTQIATTGCSGVKGFKITKKELLAKALKACKKIKNRHKRTACERTARRKYGPASKHRSSKKK
jgi:hypothetical protein